MLYAAPAMSLTCAASPAALVRAQMALMPPLPPTCGTKQARNVCCAMLCLKRWCQRQQPRVGCGAGQNTQCP